MGIILNRYIFLLLYIISTVCIYKYKYAYVIKFIQKENIITLASANIGLFASLTGFLIAAIPFFLSLILKKKYLINAVKNNLNEIKDTLFILTAIFIVSIVILLFDIKNNIALYIIWVVYLYLYIFLVYNIIEIIKMIGQFVKDLNFLKEELDVK